MSMKLGFEIWFGDAVANGPRGVLTLGDCERELTGQEAFHLADQLMHFALNKIATEKGDSFTPTATKA